jgi:actin-related protein
MGFYGVHEMISNSIIECDTDIHKNLYANIDLNSANTMFLDITERLHKEMTSLAPSTMNIKIVAAPERKFATWIGG